MKKSRVLLVIGLAVALIVTMLLRPSFSWYSRSNYENGESMKWEPTQTAYDGNGITFATYFSDDGVEYEATATNDYDSYTLAPGARVFFRTDINNSTSADQNVSLYISELTLHYSASGSKLFIGLNSPLRTHKYFPLSNAGRTSQKTAASVNQKHVYVGFRTGTYYDSSRKYGVYYWDDNSDLTGHSRLNGDFRTNNWQSGGVSYDMYYATIPWYATKYLVGEWNDANGCVDFSKVLTNGNDIYYPDNNTFLVDVVNQSNNFKSTSTAAGIENFYSSAEIAENAGTYSLAATGMSGTLSYTSTNESVATVNSSGTVTPVAPGRTTIKVTSNSFSATDFNIVASCDVEVFSTSDQSYYNVPLATNYIVGHAVDGIASTSSVYWYVENADDATANLTYDIKSLYLGL